MYDDLPPPAHSTQSRLWIAAQRREQKEEEYTLGPEENQDAKQLSLLYSTDNLPVGMEAHFFRPWMVEAKTCGEALPPSPLPPTPPWRHPQPSGRWRVVTVQRVRRHNVTSRPIQSAPKLARDE